MDTTRTPDDLKNKGGKTEKRRDEAMPSAGPHAKPELTNEDATPGAGSLPEDGRDIDGGAG